MCKPRGIAVHVGARVMSIVDGGEVLVSSTTHDLVAGRGSTSRIAAQHVLKGVESARRVYAVVA